MAEVHERHANENSIAISRCLEAFRCVSSLRGFLMDWELEIDIKRQTN